MIFLRASEVALPGPERGSLSAHFVQNRGRPDGDQRERPAAAVKVRVRLLFHDRRAGRPEAGRVELAERCRSWETPGSTGPVQKPVGEACTYHSSGTGGSITWRKKSST